MVNIRQQKLQDITNGRQFTWQNILKDDAVQTSACGSSMVKGVMCSMLKQTKITMSKRTILSRYHVSLCLMAAALRVQVNARLQSRWFES